MIEKWLKLAIVFLSLIWIATVEVVIGLPVVYLTVSLLVVFFLEQGRLIWVVIAGLVLAVVYGISWTLSVATLLIGYWAIMYGKRVIRRPALRLLLVVLLLSVGVRFLAEITVTSGVLVGFVASTSCSLLLIGKVLGWRGETKARYRPIW